MVRSMYLWCCLETLNPYNILLQYVYGAWLIKLITGDWAQERFLLLSIGPKHDFRLFVDLHTSVNYITKDK